MMKVGGGGGVVVGGGRVCGEEVDCGGNGEVVEIRV